MPALMTTRDGQRVRARKRGSTVRMLRTVDPVPAATEVRILEVRQHGRGVQYLVQPIEWSPYDPVPRVWVGGRFVADPKRRRRHG